MSDCKECISDDAENKCTTEVNAKYMNSLEEPYTYQTQVAGKAVSLFIWKNTVPTLTVSVF